MARLKRTSDGAGDSGSDIQALDDQGNLMGRHPMVGYRLLVGSPIARSYSFQDFWLTTPITEIIIEEKDYVKFKTTNSTYELWL
jgi:hypothetical protein